MSPSKSQLPRIEGAQQRSQATQATAAAVRTEQIRLLYNQATPTLVTSLMVAAVAAALLWHTADGIGLTLWITALLIVTGGRLWLIARFRHIEPNPPAQHWARCYTAGAFLGGLAWGASAWLWNPDWNSPAQVFQAFLLAGVTAAAIPANAVWLPAFVAFLLPALLPMALMLMATGSRIHVGMGAVLILYGGFLCLTARAYGVSLKQALRLHFENQHLIEGLLSANRALEAEITERRRTAQVLQRAMTAAESANRIKSEFLANVSHEIRTPMNGIVGTLELLSESPLDSDQRDLLRTAHHSADVLLTIIDDILDLARIEAGKLTLEKQPFDPGYLVEEVASLLAGPAQRKGLQLTCFIDPNTPPSATGDATRLRQILTNLLGNAVKFTERGEIVLRLHRTTPGPGAPALRFEVEDTGIGIRPEVRERLFEPFVQADASTTRRFGGTGLGLTISRRLITLMGGDIGVNSVLGQGSLFWATLPWEKPTADAWSLPATTPDLQAAKVLVVDGHSRTRDFLCQYLTAWGALPHAAADRVSARAALRRARAAHTPFSVVLLAVQRPDDIAEMIEAEVEFIQVPCIALAYAGRGMAWRRDQPCLRSLTKPIRRAQLLEAVTDALANRAPQAASMASQKAVVRSASWRGRVLLVEDNPVNQKVAVRALRNLGLTVEVADNGQKAIDATAHGSFDLVLMDCQMPQLDGFQATAAIRAREQAEGATRLPIIAMTALAMRGDRERCLAAGMDDYLPKPFKRDTLVALLDRWFGTTETEPCSATPQSL
ncbi:MAG: ATP-binding protein [Gammaproteobacteria bacterium]